MHPARVGLRYYQILSDRHEIISDRHEILSDRDVILSDRHEILSDRHVILSDRHEILSDRHEILSGRHEILSDRHEILSDRHQILSDRHEILPDIHAKCQKIYPGKAFEYKTLSKCTFTTKRPNLYENLDQFILGNFSWGQLAKKIFILGNNNTATLLWIFIF